MDLKNIRIPVFYFARSTILGPLKVLKREKVRASLLMRLIRLLLVYCERRCMKYCTKLFVKSKSMINEVCELYGADSEKVVIVTGGIDSNDFFSRCSSSRLATKRRLGIPLNTFVVLYAGRIIPQKGLLYLIQATLNLQKEKSLSVVIAGETFNQEYAMKVRALIDKSIYRRSYYFLGHIDQLTISSVIDIANCLVTPSLYEPFGMVNLQAAFLKKTVITTNRVGSIDILAEYENKKIVEARSTSAIELALREVLSSERLKVWHTVDFKKYSWQNVAKQLLYQFSSNKSI